MNVNEKVFVLCNAFYFYFLFLENLEIRNI